jgi:hypothetical protein
MRFAVSQRYVLFSALFMLLKPVDYGASGTDSYPISSRVQSELPDLFSSPEEGKMGWRCRGDFFHDFYSV